MAGILQDSLVADAAPTSEYLTDYDKIHMLVYIRMLDAADEGAAWQEVCSILFQIDARKEPQRARQVYDSHMQRAEWFSRQGYRDLLG
ncbi:MAG TPA: DUF2285 domain-containing protein [Rhizomicrobium sp.]|jgi:hypothetical protein|nr:DUF2285 domain-containing protein [Rhizomicrobium sp.]